MPQYVHGGHLFFQALHPASVLGDAIEFISLADETEKSFRVQKVFFPFLCRQLAAAVTLLSDVIDDRSPPAGVEIDSIERYSVLVKRCIRRHIIDDRL
jgi:hypothetical protein